MTPEDRLHAAITARTSSVEPSPDGLHDIEEKLMEAQRHTNRNRVLLGIGAVAAAAAIIVGVLAVTGDDQKIDTVATTTTAADQVTTTTTSPTTTTPVTGAVDPSVPVFPDATSSRRFDDPVAATRAFAVELLGFADPILGDFAQGDTRSGEVEVRSFAQGSPTTVLVRQLQDDTWFVIGASVASIRLDTPAAGSTISSPQPLQGAAYAFEGRVVVRLYADGITEPIADTFVMGRGDGVLADFTGQLDFTLPAGAKHGVLVLFEPSAKDGSTSAATVIRVHF